MNGSKVASEAASTKEETVASPSAAKTPIQDSPIDTTTDQAARLFCDVGIKSDMGSEVVQVVIGPEKKVFTIHKNLLMATGGAFVNSLELETHSKGRRITLSKESPEVFKHFVDMIYTRQVPAVLKTMNDDSKALRLQSLCRLYVMVELLELESTIRNQILDKIQDGFLLSNRLPEIPLIISIYRNTSEKSLLRKFVVACLVYQMRTKPEECIEIITKLFKASNDFINDFLKVCLSYVPCQDPRQVKIYY
ncbi:BgTH12-00053 [Blumeria graminis f. sp. triticale]|uniref:Bgt-3850 n=2 Tax=Blumeria graminis TaxID=34373 RepID=A0A9X9QF41_BLUGR|nr:BgTH12-00053 [Blumeria graminis f. sp. triticale]VDB92509.1 Bgt-3850 [Blumeria graminis f. sp. tritici]